MTTTRTDGDQDETAGPLPDAVLRYDGHEDALIDLHLPVDLDATLPLVVYVHGGFWRQAWDRTHARPLAKALSDEGCAVASVEYRRVGGAGGWPMTTEDVDAAMTALPGLLQELGLRTSTTTLVGHSAGGHLALWLAGRPHRLDRVVALAPVADLRYAAATGMGDGAVTDFLGGTPEERPDAYSAADPGTRLQDRPACSVVVVHGDADDAVPVASSRGLVERFGWIDYCELAGVDHFQLIVPGSAAWTTVLDAVRGPA